MDFKHFWNTKSRSLFQEELATAEQESVKEIIHGTNDVVIFPGRVQPPHLGHAQLISKMKLDYPLATPYIILIKGDNTSKDLFRNPFSEKEQIEMLRKVTPGIDVATWKSADLVEIIKKFGEQGLNVRAVYAGPDRAQNYITQLQQAGYPGVDVVGIDERFFPSSPLSDKYASRELSATLVREILLNNDYVDFQKVTSGFNETDFKLMQDTVRKGREKMLEAKEVADAKKDVARIQKNLDAHLKTVTDGTDAVKEQNYQAQKSQIETELITAKKKAKME